MKAKIVKKDISKEFYIEEGCFIIEASNSPDDEVMSIAQAKVEPGITTKWHYLDGIDERYLIVSGKGRVEIGEMESEIVKEGDTVFIPRGVKQRITNTGNTDLLFYCVCTPRFDKKHYAQLD